MNSLALVFLLLSFGDYLFAYALDLYAQRMDVCGVIE